MQQPPVNVNNKHASSQWLKGAVPQHNREQRGRVESRGSERSEDYVAEAIAEEDALRHMCGSPSANLHMLHSGIIGKLLIK